MDLGSILGNIFGYFMIFISIAIPVAIAGYFLWRYVGLPILRSLIMSNSEQTKAVILEAKEVGIAYSSRTNMTSLSVVQPVRVKVEVHPNNGAPYIATFRFDAKGPYSLPVGAEMQVKVSRFNRGWVDPVPGTVVESPGQRTNERLRDGQNMLKGSAVSMSGSGISMSGPGISISGVGSPNDPKAELEKLKEMLNSGLITQQDYEKKKSDILSRM